MVTPSCVSSSWLVSHSPADGLNKIYHIQQWLEMTDVDVWHFRFSHDKIGLGLIDHLKTRE
jgi:hypothetical protein